MAGLQRRHRITIDEYHRMGEAGVFAPGARVELVEGEIVDMAPIGTGHNALVNRLNRLLHKALGDVALVQVQGVISLGPFSEPQPDVAVLRPRDDCYGLEKPRAADVLLVIEVGDSTLHEDLEVKVPLYARQGIPESWVVDLRNRRLHMFHGPQGGAYCNHVEAEDPGTITIEQLPGIALRVSGLFADLAR